MPLRIGLVGRGALGGAVRDILHRTTDAVVSGVLASQPGKAGGAAGDGVVYAIDAFLAQGHDVVVECAGQAALHAYGDAVLAAGVHLVPASVGMLADDAFLATLLSTGARSGAAVRIPSGAMAGIDGLAAARHVGVDSVTYRGTMPPHALKHFDADGPVTARTLAFEGHAREAVSRFPKNANLTGTIALAGIGFERTWVELYVDPAVARNLHELEVTGAFGQFHVKVSGERISEASPSSRIVAGSLVQAALGSNFLHLNPKIR